jgi:uncharacterized lipoprotein YddW (UPF0748 family)
MRKLVVLTIILAVCGSALHAEVNYTKLDPVVELRGIWIDAGAIPKTARGIREMVRSYSRAHFNVLLPETICRGYAIYPSGFIDRDPRFAGAIDPLPVMISEAHKLGMEVHPWVWVFRAGYSKDKGSILRAHPDWAERDRDGGDLSANGGYWVSPSNPEARDYLACLYAELVTKYDVDGLHLDYIRYETEEKKPFGYSETSRRLFEKQYGIDPIDVRPGTLDQLFWNKFRERQVNTFVQRIMLQTKALRPCAVLSAAVGDYPPDARLQLMQNWPNWAANKWVDYVAPMSYSTDDTHFGRLITRQQEALHNSAILSEGLGMFMHKDTAQTTAQIGNSREMGALGQVMFAASYCGPKQLDALRCGPYASPATMPFRDLRAAIDTLCARANTLRAQGLIDLSEYYSRSAASLAEYAKYRQISRPYVVPTAPPVATNR